MYVCISGAYWGDIIDFQWCAWNYKEMRIERRKFPPLYFSEMRCNLDVCGVFPWDFFRPTFLMYCVKFDVHSWCIAWQKWFTQYCSLIGSFSIPPSNGKFLLSKVHHSLTNPNFRFWRVHSAIWLVNYIATSKLRKMFDIDGGMFGNLHKRALSRGGRHFLG